MANEQNLRPFTSEQSREKAKKNGAKGGIASGKAKRERKQFRETLEILLSMTLQDGEGQELDEIKGFASLSGQNVSVQDAILIKQVQKALKGDIRSAEYIRDSVGQKPVEKMEVKEKIENPFAGLSTEELKKLAQDG